MKSLQQLEKEARDRRAEFNATLRDVQKRMTLRGLAKEALRQIDPQFKRFPPGFLIFKRHPILAASALVGASWLLEQAFRPIRTSFKNGRSHPSHHTGIPSATSKTLKKETSHEID